MLKLLCQHLVENKMTYLQHMLHAFNLSKIMAVGSIKLIIHGIYPPIFKTTVSSTIKKLNDEKNNT